MGQVMVSSEEERTLVNEDEKSKKKEEGSSSMIKWEKFLPSISVRVLLVESDDSTRQIIGALLRKCSYKVASVSDGLQAWEVLKARPHNIDLILTEVELPSISGYALLTLIMEHEICKNIPVIMMSTHDSVSTVYKCMLRGAADFLVKPIRTNELKNLWQHVWRRQSMNRQGFGPQDESVGQQKLEATAENNATSDNSISSKSCSRRQDEGVKKGSDAQSSCGKPDLEAESGSMAEVEDQLQPMQTEYTAFGSRTDEHNDQPKSGTKLLCPESLVAGSHAPDNGNHTLDQGTRLEQPNSGEDVNPYTEVDGSKGSFHNSSREAIDLIGALHSYSRPNLYANDGANKFESSPELDLSLKRFHSDDLADKTSYEKQMLNHSNASAFTRYVYKPHQMSNGNVTFVPIPNDQGNNGDHSSDNASGSNTITKNSQLPYERKVISLPISQTKEVENGQQNSSSERLFPIPFPVRGVRVDVCATPSGRGSTNPPTLHTPSSSPTPSSTNQQPNSYHQFGVGVVDGKHHHHPLDQTPRVSSNQPVRRHDMQQFESIEERAQAQVSPAAADQIVSSRLCNGSSGHLNGFEYGSMGGNAGNVHLDAELPGGFENGNDQGHVNHDLTRQRSIQREAALNKFRLKRKERCYEKKVRYESRKKLAEQRPRVKGQFVRQVPPDPQPKTGNCGGSLVAN